MQRVRRRAAAARSAQPAVVLGLLTKTRSQRALKVSDLFVRENFASKLGEILDYHNFLLKNYFRAETVDFEKTLDEAMGYARLLRRSPPTSPRSSRTWPTRTRGILFEGAQGSFLDIDHGTYPFVTSSNTVAAAASTGTGVGPRNLDYILGIVKAYTTRVGAGPFPTELFDEQGAHIAKVGAEFGATTGRPRRCGWFDAVALRRSIVNSSVSGLCVTKLDVLDELETIQICVGYSIDGEPISGLPVVVDRFAECKPIYEEWAGWQESTVGVTNFAELPRKRALTWLVLKSWPASRRHYFNGTGSRADDYQDASVRVTGTSASRETLLSDFQSGRRVPLSPCASMAST